MRRFAPRAAVYPALLAALAACRGSAPAKGPRDFGTVPLTVRTLAVGEDSRLFGLIVDSLSREEIVRDSRLPKFGTDLDGGVLETATIEGFIAGIGRQEAHFLPARLDGPSVERRTTFYVPLGPASPFQVESLRHLADRPIEGGWREGWFALRARAQRLGHFVRVEVVPLLQLDPDPPRHPGREAILERMAFNAHLRPGQSVVVAGRGVTDPSFRLDGGEGRRYRLLVVLTLEP